MVESTDKASPIMQAQSGTNAATSLSALIGKIEKRSEEEIQSVEDLEKNFLEFGLTLDEAELVKLYREDASEVCRLFRAKLHANLKKMLDLIARENESLPEWLVDVLDAKPGAEAIVLRDSDEQQTYKNLLNTLFDSQGLTNRQYLIEQVMDSWS